MKKYIAFLGKENMLLGNTHTTLFGRFLQQSVNACIEELLPAISLTR